MKVIITGVAGFIGLHLAKNMIQEGYDVIGIDNINEYYDVNLKVARLAILGINDFQHFDDLKKYKSVLFNNFFFYKLNIENKNSLATVFQIEKPDIVINLAAQAGVRYSLENPDQYIHSNILGFHNVIQLCHTENVKIFIYASSSSVYGNLSKAPFTEDEKVDSPVSLYAATKKTNELIAHTYSHLYNLKTVGLRFFTVYGPYGRPDMAYFDFTKRIFERKEISVFNNGNLSRDFTYVDDVVKSIVLLIENETNENSKNYQIYNVGNSNPTNLMDFITSIEEAIGIKANLKFIEMQLGDVHKTYANTDKLYNKIKFKPQTNIKEGIKIFVDWYKFFYVK